MTGQVVAGRYVLGAVIGSGGTADVHRATDRLLERQVAVKVLRPSAGLGQERERFRSEISVLGRLNHPGLVSVYDAGISEAHAFLVMELVEGETLRELMQRAPVRATRAAEIGAQLASALAYAHSQGVVHRDVKPGNVLVDRSGRVKLADFGIARVLGDALHHTQTGFAVGTASYLSPEQVRGEEVTGACDVYSLGLVLLEALTGEKSFPGTSPEAAFARLNRGPHLPVTLSASWRRLLDEMTAPDPDRRPDAGAVAAELEGTAAAVPESTRRLATPRTTAVPTGDRPRRRVPAPVQVAAAAAVALSVVLVLAMAQLASGGDTPATTPDPSPGASPSTADPVAPVVEPEPGGPGPGTEIAPPAPTKDAVKPADKAADKESGKAADKAAGKAGKAGKAKRPR